MRVADSAKLNYNYRINTTPPDMARDTDEIQKFKTKARPLKNIENYTRMKQTLVMVENHIVSCDNDSDDDDVF